MEAPPLLAPPLAPSNNQERHSPLNLRCEILVYRTVISIEDGQAIPVSFLNQFPCQLAGFQITSGLVRPGPKPAKWRQELSGGVSQCLNLEQEIHHNALKPCILGFEALR